jgi:hypothetical protein
MDSTSDMLLVRLRVAVKLVLLRAAAQAAADCLEEELNAAGDDAEEHPTLRRHAEVLDALRRALAESPLIWDSEPADRKGD